MAISLKQIFNNITKPISAPAGFSLKTVALPNSGGSYQTPIVSTVPNMSIAGSKPPVTNQNMSYNTKDGLAPSATNPLNNTQVPTAAAGGGTSIITPPPSTQSAIPPQWINPAGGLYTPAEVAANIAKAATTTTGQGDIPKYAGDQFTEGKQTTEQLQSTAAGLNNSRNDIAVGATDPYSVASRSGIAYTPQELAAIEKAYAGVYDPAINSALAKLDISQKADAEKLDTQQKKDLQASAPYTLGKDDVRYDGQGNPIAVGISGTTVGPTTYVAGQDPTVDAYVKGVQNGTYKASDVPDEYKGIVAQGLAATPKKITQGATNAVSVIDQLLAKGGALGNISGIPSPGAFFPGTAAQESKNLAKQLQGMLSLEGRSALKGSGAISDFEFKVLTDAASALGIGSSGRSNLKDEDFVKELGKLKLKLQVGPTSLTDDELIHLKDQGYTPDQIRQVSAAEAGQSFSSVGNTTASKNDGKNVPQRNNNPGNVKGGGLSDSLAIGKDSQGHLIFKDPIDGFKALTLDLTAKVNGGSKYLPANPTIEQLGKVYAEDPKWGQNLARILGVSVSTHTQNIPITTLAQAVAKAEGFYA